ncbi:NAD(P)/FAD-dependent oxidoreductase [Nitrobacter sp.]|uniref:NAD(P)/FAD-dependent oxidoreductase n=1 Tax=Nitrobacter sp. TaxID=29420 RepID=UPI0029CAAE24|nr:NAD(P)/FAD-dependent oxidoreductase [Nitrobacter sp.]
MRYTDIVIVGGGLAGSITAAMLGRAGVAAIMIDPHIVYPPDLRCEKIGGTQLPRLRRTGLDQEILRSTTVDGEVWEARFGIVVARKPSDQHGVMYDTLVNATRALIPPGVEILYTKVVEVATGDERQRVVLADGEDISTRLVVLANGLSISLRHMLGLQRRVISECHSVTLGFDVAPVGRPALPFPALTYWPKRTADRLAYLTLFPIGAAMRANMMVYRPMDDVWFHEFRENPEATMRAMMPGFDRMAGDFKIVGPIKIRPADLYVTENHRQAGVVVVGDAFATSCPAAGTGTDKVFTDVERLCNVHIPTWLATEGMGRAKIEMFYDDPVKVECDTWSAAKAWHLRSLSIDDGLTWRARRWARFIGRLAQGVIGLTHKPATPIPASQPRPESREGRTA